MYYDRDFDKIEVGSVVARRCGSGWHSPSIRRHTVTRKTKTQIILDNGERYTSRLVRVGDGNSLYYGAAHIALWTTETDQELSELKEQARQERVKRALMNCSWNKLTVEQRDIIYKMLAAWTEAPQREEAAS